MFFSVILFRWNSISLLFREKVCIKRRDVLHIVESEGGVSDGNEYANFS